MYAVQFGCLNFLEYFKSLDSHQLTIKREKDGWNLLHIAVHNKRYEIAVRLLL